MAKRAPSRGEFLVLGRSGNAWRTNDLVMRMRPKTVGTAIARAGIVVAGAWVAMSPMGCAAPARPTEAGLAATRAAEDASQAVTEQSSFFKDEPAAAVSRGMPAATPTPTSPLDGEYVVTLHTKWFGAVSARMDAQPMEGGFKANTPPDVAWSLLGGVEGSVGPLLVPFIFPRGMILTWNSAMARVEPDGSIVAGEGSIGAGTLQRLRIKTRIASPGAPAELLFKDGRTVGTLTVRAAREANPRRTDYVLLAQQIREKMPGAIYNPAVAEDPKVGTFFTDLATGAARARDDLEFMFAGVASARKHIGFQMPLVFPKGPEPESLAHLTVAALADEAYKAGPDSELADVAVIRFDAFIEPRLIDEAMRLALHSHTTPRRGVILDLRTSPGVDVGAFRAAQWLISEPLAAGAYVGPKMRGVATVFPRVDLRTISDYDTLSRTLEVEDAAEITIWPLDEGRAGREPYTGPVIVVTGERTSSTSEALVAALKRSGRVRVVGQATAGRPLLSREVDLGQGWLLRVAGYDLLAPVGADPGLKDNRGIKGAPTGRRNADGEERFWQRSVVPDVRSSGDGVDEARKEMRRLLESGK